jgi:hypothetical protein
MENHYICTITDSLNKNEEIASTWCSKKTTAAAKKHFKNSPSVKKYLGDERYGISFRQNAILLQDSFEWKKNWLNNNKSKTKWKAKI